MIRLKNGIFLKCPACHRHSFGEPKVTAVSVPWLPEVELGVLEATCRTCKSVTLLEFDELGEAPK